MTSERRRKDVAFRRIATVGWVAVAVTLVSAWPQPAQAYLDPGTGSMFLQLVVGGVAGLLVLLRLYWARLKRLFGFGRADVPEPTPPSPDDE